MNKTETKKAANGTNSATATGTSTGKATSKGSIPLSARTLNAEIELVTNNAIKFAMQQPLPLSITDMKILENYILDEIRNWIVVENALNDKNETKIGRMTALPDICIAKLITSLENVCLLKRSNSAARGNCQLAVYQHECVAGEKDSRGLYVTDDNIIAKLIRRYNYSITPSKIKAVMKILQEMAPIKEVGKYKNLIAVNNGIYNYDKKELMEFSPEYIFTSKTNVDFVDKAPNIIIHNDEDGTDWDVESWMKELSDDPKVVNLLWQGVGAVIRPNVRWDKTFLLYSPMGNNGKGTYCELLRNICGAGNYSSISIEDTAKDFMLTSLLSTSAVIVDENNTSGYLDNAKNFKTMVTGDVLQVNIKYKSPVDIQFSGMIVQCINSMPRVSDKSSSFYRRLLMVPFTKCFTGRERKYIKNDYLKRREVLEYVLYRVLVDKPSYYEFDIPVICDELLGEYKTFNDPVRQFAEEILPYLVWGFVPNTFLFDLYKAWYRDNVPSGKVQGKTAFLGEIRNILTGSMEWEVKRSSVPTSGYKFDYEPFILQYNLTGWMNNLYQGNDPIKKCTPQIPSSAGGIRRLAVSSGYVPVDEEDKPFAQVEGGKDDEEE